MGKTGLTFKTKARAIELLGRSQIRDGITAINELIKNAYDADAPYVEMHFGTGAQPSDAILICDHGCGMSLDDFEKNWIVLGTTGKRDRLTTPMGRPLMGAKGVGRLAMDALGSELLLLSKTNGHPWLAAYLNWDIFDNPQLYVDQIEIPCLNIPKLDKVTLRQTVSSLRQMQMQNLALDGWYDDGKHTLPLWNEVQAFLDNPAVLHTPILGCKNSPY